MVTASRLQDLLDEFLTDSSCPGAALGVVADGETTVVAGGVLNLNTKVEATPDSVFQIGSVTKVWTATLIMQLVDAGKLDLDAPVRTYLPDFSITDADLASGVTVRHLLAHTSGIEGDIFDDVGTNDDCLARYVERMSTIGAIHQLGETWSYCNSGYVLLGRLIETVDDTGWDAAIKERLGAPLGMEHLCTSASDAIIHRASAGHISDPETREIGVAPQWSLPRAVGPAGLVTCSVADLLAFGRLHLDDGRAADGTQLLSPGTVKLMREAQADCPEPRLAQHWGLGWMLNTWDGRLVAGHGGNTIGQSAYFQTVPDRGVAVALLTNLTGGAEQAQQVFRILLDELADISMPSGPEPDDALTIDVAPLVGEYRRHGVRYIVETDNEGTLTLTYIGEGEIAASLGLDKPMTAQLRPSSVAGGYTRFVGKFPITEDAWTPVTFYSPGTDGRPQLVHMGARVSRRTG